MKTSKPSPPHSDPVQAQVHRNPVKPGGQPRLPFELPDLTEHFQKNILYNFLAVLSIHRDTIGHSEQFLLVFIQKEAKSVFISPAEIFYELCFTGRPSVDIDTVSFEKFDLSDRFCRNGLKNFQLWYFCRGSIICPDGFVALVFKIFPEQEFSFFLGAVRQGQRSQSMEQVVFEGA